MRLLQITHRFLPRYVAGVEVYTAALSRALAARGHTLEIFTGDPEAAAPYTTTWDGLPVHAQPWGWPAGRGAVGTFLAGLANPPVESRFRAVLRAFRPEVVHVQQLLGLSPALIGLARASGARVVVTLHDYWFVCSNTWLFRWTRAACPGPGWGYYCGGCALHRLGRRPQPALMALAAPLFLARTRRLAAALRAAHQLIAPSETVARMYRDLGLVSDGLKVIPHGVSDSAIQRFSDSAIQRVPLNPQSKIPNPQLGNPQSAIQNPQLTAVYLGSLIPPKGVHIAIAAFNALSDPRARLEIYGDEGADPEYAAELRALARHPGIAFHGALPRARVAEALAAADVLLAPALWPETFGIVIDEARQAGLAVLVAAGGALAEKVRPEEDGLLAPPGDVAAWRAQLERLLREPGLLSRLRSNPPGFRSQAWHVGEIEAVYADP